VTFSIAARDPQNGWLGVATSSKALASGGLVPYVRTGVGAIASQSFVNPYLGIDGLSLLADGLPAERVLERLIEEDPGRDLRQLGIVDRDGRVAAFTGDRCIPWAGQIMGGGYVCLGNILHGEGVVKEMAIAFERSVGEPLYERLMRTLEAGQEAGGDRRGRQSAGMRILGDQEYPLCDIRVDDHEDPVPELRRVLGVFEREEIPYLMVSPKRGDYTPQWRQVLQIRDQIEQELDEQQADAQEAVSAATES
jgi:uncharacterized Ntn-hydrolase superfamily protein